MKRCVPILSISSMGGLLVVLLRAEQHGDGELEVAGNGDAVGVRELFGSTMSTFSSMAMQSGLVRHMGSMFLVASPQTKKEEGIPFSRMEAKNFV